MNRFLTFNKRYFALTLLLLVVEILIAKYAHDEIVRPYVGDVLVVILLYCFVKSLMPAPVLPTALWVLLFSFVIEGLQYLKIVNKLGLQHHTIAAVVIGTSFSWMDILCYIMGIALVFIVERYLQNR